MLNNLNFNAEISPKEAIKVGMDLQMPESMAFKFSISGECDRETLKRFIRVIKSEAKDATTKSSKI